MSRGSHLCFLVPESATGRPSIWGYHIKSMLTLTSSSSGPVVQEQLLKMQLERANICRCWRRAGHRRIFKRTVEPCSIRNSGVHCKGVRGASGQSIITIDEIPQSSAPFEVSPCAGMMSSTIASTYGISFCVRKQLCVSHGEKDGKNDSAGWQRKGGSAHPIVLSRTVLVREGNRI